MCHLLNLLIGIVIEQVHQLVVIRLQRDIQMCDTHLPKHWMNVWRGGWPIIAFAAATLITERVEPGTDHASLIEAWSLRVQAEKTLEFWNVARDFSATRQNTRPPSSHHLVKRNMSLDGPLNGVLIRF